MHIEKIMTGIKLHLNVYKCADIGLSQKYLLINFRNFNPSNAFLIANPRFSFYKHENIDK